MKYKNIQTGKAINLPFELSQENIIAYPEIFGKTSVNDWIVSDNSPSAKELYAAGVRLKIVDVNSYLQGLTSDEALAETPKNLLYLSVFDGAISACIRVAQQNPSATAIAAIISVVDAIQAPEWCDAQDIVSIVAIKDYIKDILQR